MGNFRTKVRHWGENEGTRPHNSKKIKKEWKLREVDYFKIENDTLAARLIFDQVLENRDGGNKIIILRVIPASHLGMEECFKQHIGSSISDVMFYTVSGAATIIFDDKFKDIRFIPIDDHDKENLNVLKSGVTEVRLGSVNISGHGGRLYSVSFTLVDEWRDPLLEWFFLTTGDINQLTDKLGHTVESLEYREEPIEATSEFYRGAFEGKVEFKFSDGDEITFTTPIGQSVEETIYSV